MRHVVRAGLAIVWFLLLIGTSQSATIGFAATSPDSPVAGKITGVGTYVVGKTEIAQNVRFNGYTKGGGPAFDVEGNMDDTNKTWDASASGLVSGNTYTCYAVLTYKVGMDFKMENSAEKDKKCM